MTAKVVPSTEVIRRLRALLLLGEEVAVEDVAAAQIERSLRPKVDLHAGVDALIGQRLKRFPRC